MAASETTPLERLQGSNLTSSRLDKADFDLSEDTANERTKIAAFDTPQPLVLKEAPIRMVITTLQKETTDGSGSNTFTFGHEVVDTPNTAPVAAWTDQGSGDWTRVASSNISVDFGNNTFTYDDGGSAEDLAVYYVARDPVKLELWKEKPGTTGNVGEMLYDDYTADLHVRNQNDEAPELQFKKSEYEAVIPQDWRVSLYAEGDYALGVTDSATPTYAPNAIINVPAFRSPTNVSGLSRAVTSDIGSRL